MSRKSKQWLLRNAKVLAVCGAMLYLANGLSQITVADVSEVTEAAEEETVNFAEVPLEIEGEIAEIEEAETEESETLVASKDWDSDESYLLAKIAMAEAESEDTEGKALVILVVLNRVWSDKFPDTIEEVIFQEGQFSPVSEGGRWWSVEPDQDCWDALEMVMYGWDESQGALYFESKSASKWHEQNLNFLFQHGNHYFYSEKEN